MLVWENSYFLSFNLKAIYCALSLKSAVSLFKSGLPSLGEFLFFLYLLLAYITNPPGKIGDLHTATEQ